MKLIKKYSIILAVLMVIMVPVLFTSETTAATRLYVNGDNVRVRSTPTTESNSNIIGQVDTGDVCMVLSEEDGWTEVSVEGLEGYIRNDFLQSAKIQAGNANSSSKKTSTNKKTSTKASSSNKQVESNQSNVEMVWIPTKGGTKIHSNSGCSGMKNPAHVTIDEAHNRGFYDYCKKCY